MFGHLPFRTCNCDRLCGHLCMRLLFPAYWRWLGFFFSFLLQAIIGGVVGTLPNFLVNETQFITTDCVRVKIFSSEWEIKQNKNINKSTRFSHFSSRIFFRYYCNFIIEIFYIILKFLSRFFFLGLKCMRPPVSTFCGKETGCKEFSCIYKLGKCCPMRWKTLTAE